MPLKSTVEDFKDYMGISPKAEDFDKYWAEGVRDLKGTDFSYTLEKRDFPMKDIEVYDMYFKGMNGERVHCELVKPKHIEGKIPGVMSFHGYTSNADSIYSKVPYAYNDMAFLAFEVPGQGGKSEDNYTADGPTLYGQIIRGVMDKDKKKLFFRNIYLDAVKAFVIFENMDFIDEKRIGTTGKSQGGALSLVVAAFNKNVKASAVIYPFLADFKKVFEMNMCEDVYVEFKNWFRKYDTLHKKEDEFFERLSYIDVQNFADKVKCDVLFFTALLDTTCPPITQFSIYNKLKCNKELKVYCEYTHERLPYSDDIIYEFFKEKL